MPAAAATAGLPGAGASREPADVPPAEGTAEQGIWLCSGGELPAALLAALTGRAPWAPLAGDKTHECGDPAYDGRAGAGDAAACGASEHRPGAEGAGVGGAGVGGAGVGGAGGSASIGFVQGGVLDGLAPGPELAMFLQDAVGGAAGPTDPGADLPDSAAVPHVATGPAPHVATGPAPHVATGEPDLAVCLPGLGRLSDAALTGVVRGWRRLASWVAAMEHAAVAELAERRIGQAEAAGCWAEEAGQFAGAEVAAALTLTRTAADTLVGRALKLRQRQATAAALGGGRIDLPRALVITEGLSCLEPGLAAAVETRVLAKAPAQTTGQLRAAVARAVLAADPAAAETRRRETEQQARVEHRPEPGGVTAMLAGRDLPAAESAAAANRITALAAALKSDGAQGCLDLLRAHVFLGLLLGRPIAAPARDHEPTEPRSTEPGSTRSAPAPGSPAGPPRVTAGACDGGPPGSSHTISYHTMPSAGSINLTVPLTTWLGLADAPGELAGYGPVPAETVRHLLAGAIGDLAARWCLTVTDDADRAIAHGCARPRRGEARETDSSRERQLGATGWQVAITTQPLATGDCAHRRESASYTPPQPLRHVVEIRDRTCAFPGCRQPAARCDKDHTIAHSRGGRTCECNLGSLCRFHHRLKQARGWQLTQPAPGIFTWTTPSGWRYTNAPHLLR